MISLGLRNNTERKRRILKSNLKISSKWKEDKQYIQGRHTASSKLYKILVLKVKIRVGHRNGALKASRKLFMFCTHPHVHQVVKKLESIL